MHLLDSTGDRLIVLRDVALVHGIAHDRLVGLGEFVLRARLEEVGGGRVRAVQDGAHVGEAQRRDEVREHANGRHGRSRHAPAAGGLWSDVRCATAVTRRIIE